MHVSAEQLLAICGERSFDLELHDDPAISREAMSALGEEVIARLDNQAARVSRATVVEARRIVVDRREQRAKSEPVGLAEIADRLGVQRATVDQWRTRGLLPKPRWTVGGRPAWAWDDVEAWAESTGRGQ